MTLVSPCFKVKNAVSGISLDFSASLRSFGGSIKCCTRKTK